MEEEFDKLYRETAKSLYWTAFALVKDREIAENAVQETFLHVWRHRGKLLGSDFLYPYLLRSVRNYVLNHLRDAGHYAHGKEGAMDVAGVAAAAPEVDEEEYGRRVERAWELVNGLPEKCRESFVRCVVEGMSYAECAEAMDCSVNTVKYHIGGITVILTLCGRWKRIFCHHLIKKLAEIICHTKYYCNFAFGDHSDYCLYFFVFQYYKDATIFADHQFYKLS